MLVNTYIDAFLDMMRVEKSASFNTIASYKTDLFSIIDSDSISFTNEKISSYVSYLNSGVYSPSTIFRKIVVLRAFFHFLYTEGFLEEDFSRNIKPPKLSSGLPKCLSLNELKSLFGAVSLFKYPKSLRIRAVIELLYASGIRISELVIVKCNDIRFDDEYPHLIVKGKGDRERLVPLNDSATYALREYIKTLTKSSDWLFPGKKNNSHVTRQAVARWIKFLAVSAGLDKRKVSPHIFRHTCATHLLDNEIDIKILKKILGHSSISTTQIYTSVSQAKSYDAVKKNHPLFKL